MTVQSNFGLYNSGTYIPFTCNITGVANGVTTVVTTAVDHGFVVGNTVQFSIPKQWGIVQLDQLKGFVSEITSDTLTVLIDSSAFNAFVTPVVVLPVVIDQPQVIPIGDMNTGNINAAITPASLQIPGTFRNTYP